MTGLLLMLVGIVWTVIVSFLVRFKADFILPKPPWRKVVQVGLFVALLPLPLIDEIVGGWQFARFCEIHSGIQLDRQKIIGTTIYFVPKKSTYVSGTWIPIRHQSWLHVDKTSGTKSMQYDSFHVKGGWLVRMLRISEGDVPLLFRDACFPKENPATLLKSLNVTTLDFPVEQTKAQ